MFKEFAVEQLMHILYIALQEYKNEEGNENVNALTFSMQDGTVLQFAAVKPDNDKTN